MGAFSHVIEIRKFMGKCLVCDVQIQEVSLSAAGLSIQTNKWLHLENWLEFDASLEELLQSFQHSETLDGFETDTFYLDGHIRIDCKKIKTSRAHMKILGQNKKYLPVALNIQITKIDTKNLMDQISYFENKLNQMRQNTNGISKEEDKNAVHTENLREYDPTINSIGNEQSTNEYVPYKASAKTTNGPSSIEISDSVLNENEPYSPKPVLHLESSPDQILESPVKIPKYKPARIAQHPNPKGSPEQVENRIDGQEKEELNLPNPSRRVRSPIVSEDTKPLPSSSQHHSLKRSLKKEKMINAELFGTDDSDQEQPTSLSRKADTQDEENSKQATPKQVVESPKRVLTPIRTPNNSDRLHQEIKRKRYKLRHESSQKNLLDGWLSKSSLKTEEKSNGKSSKKSSRHTSSNEVKTESSKKLSDEQTERQNQEIQALSNLMKTIKSKKKSPPPELDILNINHLSSEDILETFKDIKPRLDHIFNTYSKKTKVTGFKGINHMKTIMLIDDRKQLQMMNFLRENYQPEETGVPTLTDLYINALVPEWTLSVFMEEFRFTRSEAIKRLDAQEESSAYHNNESIDSSTLIYKIKIVTSVK